MIVLAVLVEISNQRIVISDPTLINGSQTFESVGIIVQQLKSCNWYIYIFGLLNELHHSMSC